MRTKWLLLLLAVLLAPSAAPELARAQPTEPEPIVVAHVGAALRSRNLGISFPDGTRRGYDILAYAELMGQVEARPLVTLADEEALLAGMFARAHFAHSLELDSQVNGSAVETRFLRMGLDVGWLFPVDDEVELGLGFGFVFDGYYLSANALMPATEYLALRPTFRYRHDLLETLFVLELEGAYRGVVGFGGLNGAFGEDTEVHGFDLSAAIVGDLRTEGAGFAYGVRFTWVTYLLFFSGAATSGAASDGGEHSARLEGFLGWAF